MLYFFTKKNNGKIGYKHLSPRWVEQTAWLSDQWNSLWGPLDMGLGWTQRRSGDGGEEENPWPCWEPNPVVQPLCCHFNNVSSLKIKINKILLQGNINPQRPATDTDFITLPILVVRVIGACTIQRFYISCIGYLGPNMLRVIYVCERGNGGGSNERLLRALSRH